MFYFSDVSVRTNAKYNQSLDSKQANLYILKLYKSANVNVLSGQRFILHILLHQPPLYWINLSHVHTHTREKRLFIYHTFFSLTCIWQAYCPSYLFNIATETHTHKKKDTKHGTPLLLPYYLHHITWYFLFVLFFMIEYVLVCIHFTYTSYIQKSFSFAF